VKGKIFILLVVVFGPLLLPVGAHASGQKRLQNVIVAVPRDYPPNYCVHKDGRPSGFAVDVMDEVARLANLQVKYVVKDNWPETADALVSGEADIIPNLGISAARQAVFDFTIPYEVNHLSLFVQKKNGDINTVQDLAGKVVAVVQFNVSSQYVKDVVAVKKTLIFKSEKEALFSLLAGEVDAFIYPETVLWRLAHKAGVENQIKVVGEPLLEINRAMAVRKGNARLWQRLELAMNQFLTTDEYKNIYAKWYGVRTREVNPRLVFFSIAAIICCGGVVIGAWRYRLVTRLNKKLACSLQKQKRVETKLHQAMMALEKADEGVFWIELSGRFFYVNEAATQSLGYSRDELQQMHVWDIDPDYKEDIWPEYINHLQLGDSLIFKTRHQKKDGAIFPVEIKSQYLSCNDKLFICAFAQDITEREAACSALEESEMRQRAILDNIADSIITIDQEGVIESFNRAAEKAFGYTANEVVGRNVSMLMPEPDSLHHDEYLQRYIVSGAQGRELCGGPRETIAKRKDDSVFPIDLSVREMILEGKRIFIGVILDISDRKDIEEAIIRQKSELEAAKQAEELKSKFLAMVSHELRTPLTPIIGFAERIIKKPPPREKVELFASHICQNAKHLQEIINDLLDFSKIEARRMPLDVKPVAFSTIIDQLRSSIQHLVEAKELQFAVEIPSDLPLLAVDILRVKQVLFNLVSNAVKFTPKGGQIIVTAKNINESLEVMVRDTGKGISPEDQLLIFDHFVQVQRQQQEQQGTGLGLTIAKKLVELHGGKIWVESKPGDGTAFFFTLPVNAEDADG